LGNQALLREQRGRARIELMNSRELADNNLRKDMFDKVINQFIGSNPNKEIDSRILNLELLTYNFHESIDLGPLLKQVYFESRVKTTNEKQRKRLQSLARDIVSRELAALEETGCILKSNEESPDDPEFIDFEVLKEEQIRISALRGTCKPTNKSLSPKWFNVDVMTNPTIINLANETELDLVLTVGDSAEDPNQKRFEFSLTPFDFPLIDNTRLDNEGRVAVVMTNVAESGVTLRLAYFPASRSSIKDKPYLDDVVKEIQ
jgi:hypothetical protein